MCAILGMIGVQDAGALTAAGLGPMQHRGEQGAGVTVRNNGVLKTRRRLGTLSKGFPRKLNLTELLPGDAAIGHLRYATTGDADEIESLQPLTLRRMEGDASFVHNGNLLHYEEIRRDMERRGKVLHTSSDTELLLNYWAESQGATSQERFIDACARADGAWSVLALTGDALIAASDPFGFRPLVLGSFRGGTVVASETCALQTMDAKILRYVEPGEVVTVANDGTMTSTFPFEMPARQARCIFELVYFLAPHSRVPTPLGIRSAQWARKALGAALARNLPEGFTADVVMSVPDSANAAGLAFAQECGIPFTFGLIRSHTGQSAESRSYTQPTAELQAITARRKTGIVEDEVDGKDVVMVDDSIIRGTTMRQQVRRVRAAGARKVHVYSISPRVTHTCNLGIVMPKAPDLIANRMSEAELCKYIEADSVVYQREDTFVETLGDVERKFFCTHCFTGHWPIPPDYLLRRNRS